jgi:CRISPR-associated protein Cmr2
VTNEEFRFDLVIAKCLTFPREPSRDLVQLVAEIQCHKPPNRKALDALYARAAALPDASGRVSLIYGGATKIKDYVFEAPKLPEIRGASALLDWINGTAWQKAWDKVLRKAHPSADLPAEDCVVYARGGNILAFAPAQYGQALATEIERIYTRETLLANSAAVSETFDLVELRFGRNPRAYWLDEFERDWKNPKLHELLHEYYYLDVASLPERFFNRKTFGELVTLLATRFNQRRDERASHGEARSAPLYALNPWLAKCDSSDTRPAMGQEMLRVGIEEEERAMSEPSARKRYAGQRAKRAGDDDTRWFHKAFTGWELSKEFASWEDKWDEYLQKHPECNYAQVMRAAGTKPLFPQDLGEIAQASSPARYIGMIYADGDNVGRLIATINTPGSYKQISETLSNAAQNAVFSALAEYLRPADVRSERGAAKVIHPFEVLSIGGDDLLVLVPGSAALDIACMIGTQFERDLAPKISPFDTNARSSADVPYRYRGPTELTTQPYTPSIGLSAGVVIAQENTPIFFLRNLAEELQKGAKKLAKKRATKLAEEETKHHFYGGAVDWMVLKSVTMVTDDVAAFRRVALHDEGDKSKRRQTLRPYNWHEFAGLLVTVRALKKANVPRSQLYRLRGALATDTEDAGIASSVMEYLYTRARLRHKDVRKVLLEQLEIPWCSEGHGAAALPPWRLGAHGYETVLPDLMEVYDMIPELQTQEIVS